MEMTVQPPAQPRYWQVILLHLTLFDTGFKLVMVQCINNMYLIESSEWYTPLTFCSMCMDEYKNAAYCNTASSLTL